MVNISFLSKLLKKQGLSYILQCMLITLANYSETYCKPIQVFPPAMVIKQMVKKNKKMMVIKETTLFNTPTVLSTDFFLYFYVLLAPWTTKSYHSNGYRNCKFGFPKKYTKITEKEQQVHCGIDVQI